MKKKKDKAMHFLSVAITKEALKKIKLKAIELEVTVKILMEILITEHLDNVRLK
jgi:hypothetical protein